MGIESFYVNIEMKNEENYDFSKVVVLFSEVIDNKRNITISYSLVSFFDGLRQIYSFIKENEANIYLVESRRENITSSTGSFMSFLEKMFMLWKIKIDSFQSQYGALIVKSGEEFFTAYKKGLKKYLYKK